MIDSFLTDSNYNLKSLYKLILDADDRYSYKVSIQI